MGIDMVRCCLTTVCCDTYCPLLRADRGGGGWVEAVRRSITLLRRFVSRRGAARLLLLVKMPMVVDEVQGLRLLKGRRCPRVKGSGSSGFRV